MEARKLLYSIMVCAPLVLMGAIGVHARTYVDPYEWPTKDLDHTRVSAYIPLSLATEDLVTKNDAPSEGTSRRIASLWITGGRKGELKPLVPASLDELMPNGNKARIIDSNGHLARRLVDFADRRIAVGEYGEAARNLILASDTVTTLKYSSFMVLFRMSLVQSGILRRIETVYPRVGAKDRQALVACMERMKGDRKEFSAIARRARQIIQAEIRRHEGADEFSDEAGTNAFFEQPALAKERKGISEGKWDGAEFLLPDQRMEASQCLHADERNRLTIRRIMSLIKDTKPL